MKPINEAWLMQIDVTNVCGRGCIYCSRYDRHIRLDQRYFMELDYFEQALQSLKDWPSKIGIIGGEPVYHPHFKELCFLVRDYFPPGGKTSVMLWTSGGPLFEKYKPLIKKSFKRMGSINEHNLEQQKLQQHQPTTIAIGEAVNPGKYRDNLINNCWVQKKWCPSITNKGGFFCEVAGAMDIILDGPGGYNIEPGWWKKIPEQFQDQVDRYCLKCSMAIPMKRQFLNDKVERFTPKLKKEYVEHDLPGMDKVKEFPGQFSIIEIEAAKKAWDPGNFRGDLEEGCP